MQFKRIKLHVLVLVLVLNFNFKLLAKNEKRPNVIVVFADDIGIGDISFYHKERTAQKPWVQTPNIDELISQGMRFSDAHTSASLSAPSRFAMMTGNWPYRNTKRPWGVWSPSEDAGIEPNFTTVARIAKKGGYKTAFFGKWGLGGVWDDTPKDINGYEQVDKGANYYGFEYSVILPQGIQAVPFAYYENGKFMKIAKNSQMTRIPFKQLKYANENKRVKEGSPADSNWDPSLAGGVLANKAVTYINQQADNNDPFYMYYCSQAVHVPHTPPVELNGKKIADATLATHGDMIVELDVQVGMLVDALKQKGMYENTLFIFTSDNGGLNEDESLRKVGHDSSNGLRDKKGSIHEGGHRVPFIAVWPHKIKANTQSDIPIVCHDIVATIASIAEVPVDKTKIFDSANLLPILKERSNKPLHKYLMHASQASNGPFYALRQGDFKLIMKGEKMAVLGELTPIELYNLKDNLKEDPSKNLINKPEYAKKIKQMKEKYLELRNDGASTLY